MTENQSKLRKVVDEQIKKNDRKEFFSPLSLVGLVWIVGVFVLPYVMGWMGMANSFFNSLEFEGILSLVFIATVVLTVADKAASRFKVRG